MGTTVELPSEVVERLVARASETGLSASELATQAIAQFLEQDPYEFVGSFSSESLRGRDVDELLADSDFGR